MARRVSSRRRALLPFVLACVALAPPAGAVVVAEMSDEMLAASADLVVLGRVTAMRSRAGEGIFWAETDVTIRIERVLRGAWTPEAVVVTVPGGRRGDLVQVIPGAPRFAVGSRFVAFLVRSGARWAVQGWAQGLFEVQDDDPGKSPTGDETVTRDLDGLTTTAGRATADRTRRLADLLATVRRRGR